MPLSNEVQQNPWITSTPHKINVYKAYCVYGTQTPKYKNELAW